jgi:hypothetical protein
MFFILPCFFSFILLVLFFLILSLSFSCFRTQRTNGVNGEMLCDSELKEDDLSEVGVGARMHRRRLMALVQEAKQQQQQLAMTQGKEGGEEEGGEGGYSEGDEGGNLDDDYDDVDAEYPDDFELPGLVDSLALLLQ